MVLFVLVLVMWFSPKIATATDILLRPKLLREFGGAARFLGNFAIETVYSILLCPIVWFGHTIFLTGLMFGREIGWIGQTRDDHAVPFALALRNLWPHTLLGWGVIGLLADDTSGGDPLMRCSSPPGRRWPCRSPCSPRCPRSAKPSRASEYAACPKKPRRLPRLMRLALPAIEAAAPSPHPQPV